MGAEKTTLPPPYCIIPHDTGKTQYKEGEVFSFRLLLFSYAREYLPYFVHAMILAGIRGMGKSSESCKGTFEIDKILWNDLNIYQKEKQKVHIPDGKELIVPAWTPCEQDMGLLLVHLNSPCRFKNDNRLSSQLEFSQLLTLIIRRIRSLWELEGEHIQLEYFHEMMALAASISVRESFLFWKDWTRYSSRQGTSMQLGGLQGSIRYHGRIASFLPFL
jgi:hypothetical protein